jgi:hypothetical protein
VFSGARLRCTVNIYERRTGSQQIHCDARSRRREVRSRLTTVCRAATQYKVRDELGDDAGRSRASCPAARARRSVGIGNHSEPSRVQSRPVNGAARPISA